MSRRSDLSAACLVSLLVTTGPLAAQVAQGEANADFVPAFAGQTRAPALPATAVEVTEFATGLDHAWGIAELPDGTFLVTEREGRLRVVGADGTVQAPVEGVPAVYAQGQGGLLDVAVAEDFASTRQLWLTYAEPLGGGLSSTTLATARLSDDGRALTDLRVIWRQDPGIASNRHFGSRVVIDGDHLFLTTGDRGQHFEPEWLQSPDSPAGKVFRLTRGGAIPADNPFGNAAWTIGHRNVQGAALDGQGRLWTIEHGPMGGDELNLSQRGANFGWPVISYGIDYSGRLVGVGQSSQPGFVEPAYYWDPVIAPGGMVFYDGDLFPGWEGDLLIGSLNPGALVRLRMDGTTVTGEERLVTDHGRIRDVELTSDGSLLLLVDEPGGAILRVRPAG